MIAIILSTVESPDDRDFMVDLYTDYHRLMFSKARQFCPKQEDCEDLVQTCLVQLIEKISTLRALSCCKLCAYIVSTIRNTFYTQYARNKREVSSCISLEEVVGPTDQSDDFVAELLNRMNYDELMPKLWEILEEEDRFLLEGRYFLRMTDEELSQGLGCRSSSIRMKLTRARRNARAIVERLEEDTEDVERCKPGGEP